MARGLFDLSGKVVLATGSNSGIGLGFLRGCAKQGASVVVWGRRADKNREATDLLKQLGAPAAYAEAVDVADEQAVAKAFEASVTAMGRIDCVFANAGFTSHAKSFPDMESKMYHDLLNVNLHGAFYVLREATAHARACRSGGPGRIDCRLREPVDLSGSSGARALRGREGGVSGHDQGPRGGDGKI